MYAVIKTGGKQYKVAANDKLLIEKLEGEAGDQITFTEVLMVGNGADVAVGAPWVAGATVVAEIDKQARGPRLIIFKKRRRKHYRRRNGHRQDLTSIIITQILTDGAKPDASIKAVRPVRAMPAIAAVASDGKSDDISLIGGIGPKNEEILRGLGYHTFASIAAWSAEDVARIGAQIKPAGRIAREEWVEQAAELMAGKPPRAKSDRERT